MARIRHIEIKHFRCIRSLEWMPSPGVNCFIGPGDSGKSSLLDAIDLCLGARRTVNITDVDFYHLNVETPILVTVTLGDLEDTLKSFESYGDFIRGFNRVTGKIEDEPGQGLETVVTLRVTVLGDLEPVWTLVSDRAAAQGQSRSLNWNDRVRLAPTRIGALAEQHLGWRRGSVLNRLSEERPEASAALAAAGRDARRAFGTMAEAQLGNTLRIVSRTAKELGIPIGDAPKAMLDAHSVSFTGGTIALHGENGVPLRALGVGSTRLLIAGLQRKAAEETSIVLIDELEHGLEPHRIIRLLGSIGVKEKTPPLQAFVTTHSPVALRELSGDQLVLVRKRGETHHVAIVGSSDDIQGTIRSAPDAFLAPSVIVCEGASEVGFLRGLDQFLIAKGHTSMMARGVALVDAGGCGNIYKRAKPLQAFSYRVAAFRDDDRQPDAGDERSFADAGGAVFKWRSGKAIEDELCACLSDEALGKLLDHAVALHGVDLINAQLSSETRGAVTLEQCRAAPSADIRAMLGKVARNNNNSWFKSVSAMEDLARYIVGPDLETGDATMITLVSALFEWSEHAEA